MKPYRQVTTGMLMSSLLLTGACAGDRDRTTAEQYPADGGAGTHAEGGARSDSTIATEIQSRFYSDDEVRGRRVDVRVNDGTVVLAGAVHSDEARRRAASIAEDVTGVQRVDNRLEVDPEQAQRGRDAMGDQARVAPATEQQRQQGQQGTAQRDTDNGGVNAGWITTRIQAQYFISPDVRPWNVDVTTSDTGVVSLAGEVETQEARSRAAEIAEQIDGVRRVDNQLRVAPRDARRDDDTRGERRDGAAQQQQRTDADRAGGEMAAAQPQRQGAEERGDDANDTNDGWVTTKIQAKYFMDTDVAWRRIDVTTQDGVVTLDGEVRSEAERRQAVATARNTDGVRSVNDKLRLVREDAADRPRETGVAARGDGQTGGVNDTWVTTKIQSKYFLEGDVKGRDVDVTTNKGVVTLTGVVESPQARETAEAIARETDGVTRVVNQLRVDPTGGDRTDTRN